MLILIPNTVVVQISPLGEGKTTLHRQRICANCLLWNNYKVLLKLVSRAELPDIG
jgi:hypothetical protein